MPGNQHLESNVSFEVRPMKARPGLSCAGSRAVATTRTSARTFWSPWPHWTTVFDRSAQVLSGAAKDTYNDFGKAEAINAQDLPALSYSICGKTLFACQERRHARPEPSI